MGRQKVKDMSRRQQKAFFANLGKSDSTGRQSNRAKIIEKEFGGKERARSQLAKSLNVRRNVVILKTPDEVHDAVFDYHIHRNLRVRTETNIGKEKTSFKPDNEAIADLTKKAKIWKKKEAKDLSLLKKLSKKHKLDYQVVIRAFD